MNRPFCNICNYEHKVRPKSFCKALHSKQGLDSLDHDEFLTDWFEIYKNGDR